MAFKNIKMKNDKAFTLIEILIGVMISTILMISIGYLVTGGIANITTQKQLISNSMNIFDFQKKISQIFFNIDTSFLPIKTSSGVILKIKQSYNEGGFVYIGLTRSPIKNGNGIYCLSGSENINTNHIFIKTFIPFEESGEDLFNNFSKILDSKININGIEFKTLQKDHKLLKNNSLFIGKKLFGRNFFSSNGAIKNNVYLNSPTGLANSGNILFFSDTLNNRILYTDISKSDGKVYELLNEKDGLQEPTGLYYSDSDNILYIANSGKGEILKYSSKQYIPPSFLKLTNISGTSSNFYLNFYNSFGNKDIISPTSKDNFVFSSYLKENGDSVSTSGNKLTYTFSGGLVKTFNNETITINNLKDFSATGAYFVKLTFGGFKKYYSYFTQGDNNILTKEDNTLETIEITNKYPNNISSIGNYNYFLDGNYSNLKYDEENDFILKTPISSFYTYYDSNKKLLKINIEYFEKYNCYNLDDKQKKELIILKNFK